MTSRKFFYILSDGQFGWADFSTFILDSDLVLT